LISFLSFDMRNATAKIITIPIIPIKIDIYFSPYMYPIFIKEGRA
jgi:hypothetical protein